MSQEPTEFEIRNLMKENPNHSWYSAREELREKAYKDIYDKPDGMSWGTFWKTY